MSRATWTFGFEDASEEVREPEVTTEVVEEREVPSETVEAELVEVEGLDREICELDRDGVRLSQDIDGLEKTEEVVADSLEDGGINEAAARTVNVATESFCARWGIEMQRVATESFATGSRYQATKIACESLSETVSKGWETFKSWVKAASDKRKDLWAKYVNLGSRLQKRILKARRRLTDVDWSKKVDYDENYFYESSGLLLNGKIDTDGVIKYLEDFSKDVTKVGKKVTDTLSLMKIGGDNTNYSRTNAYWQILGTLFGVITGNLALVVSATVLNGIASRANASSMIPRTAEDVKVIAMPGENYYITYTTKENGPAAYAFRGGITGIKGIMKAYGLHNTPVKPTREDCVKFLNGAEVGAKAIEAHIKDWRTSEDKITQASVAITEATKKLKEAKKSGDIDGAELARAQLRVARAGVKALGDYMTITSKAAVDGVRGLIHAAEQVQFMFLRRFGMESHSLGKVDINWKYAKPVDKSAISDVESHFGVTLPTDYKNLLPEINSAKPSKVVFDIDGRKGCVLDYMEDIAKVISTSKATGHKDFICIASDPFGNQIGYRIVSGKISDLYFLDHEIDTFTKCASSITALIGKLH